MNNMLMNIEETNCAYIRDYMINLVNLGDMENILNKEVNWKIDSNESRSKIPIDDINFVKPYFRLLLEAQVIGLIHYKPEEYVKLEHKKYLHRSKLRPNNKDADNIKKIVYQDLSNSHVGLCTSAWLTVDNFKFLDPTVPNLKYGLVAKYPEFIIPYCAYVSNLYRDYLKRTFIESNLKLQSNIEKDIEESLKLIGLKE